MEEVLPAYSSVIRPVLATWIVSMRSSYSPNRSSRSKTKIELSYNDAALASIRRRDLRPDGPGWLLLQLESSLLSLALTNCVAHSDLTGASSSQLCLRFGSRFGTASASVLGDRLSRRQM